MVEIKRPTTPLLSSRPTRGNTYGVSKDLSDAVAQLQTYCHTWGTNSSREAYSFQARNNSVTVLPQGILVIGNTSPDGTSVMLESCDHQHHKVFVSEPRISIGIKKGDILYVCEE